MLRPYNDLLAQMVKDGRLKPEETDQLRQRLHEQGCFAMTKRSGVRCCDSSTIARCKPMSVSEYYDVTHH